MSRRDDVLQAAIGVTAAGGVRGLTHKAVDLAGGLPAGTTSNYFRTRNALTVGTLQFLAGAMTGIIAHVGATPVRTLDDVADTLGTNLATALGPGREFAAAASALFAEAGIDESLHATVLATNRQWWLAIEGLLRAAGVTKDVENKAKYLLSYGNGLVVDQLALRDPHFDAIAAMRTAIRGFGV